MKHGGWLGIAERTLVVCVRKRGRGRGRERLVCLRLEEAK